MSVAGPAQEGLSRRQLLKATGAVAIGGGVLEAARLLTGLGAGLEPQAPTPAAHTFFSRPDLRPAAVSAAGARTSGYVFLSPGTVGGSQSGPLIVDERGDPLWFTPMTGSRWATNFRVQRYRGEPVLTWWEGNLDKQGYGYGEVVIADARYRELARVRGGNGRAIDMHEQLLSPRGTVLVTCYPEIVPADLSSISGPSDGTVFESIIQEIDIRSGRVVFEWRSLDHVPVAESYRQPGGVCDYLHANSIDLLPDGHLLISARNTWALYKLDRESGNVIWRLGGKRSDFALGAGVHFAWQHDARYVGPGIMTVFDDGSNGPIHTESQSRGLKLEVDSKRRTVRLAASYIHPERLLTSSMGDVQLLPDGRVFVGWGAQPYLSQFTAGGMLITDFRLVKHQTSYRGYILPWRGRPSTSPAVAVRQSRRTGESALFVSWNGATEVARWRLRAGATASALRPVRTVARVGFETSVALGSASGYVAVDALDSTGRELATSGAVRL